MRGSFDDLARSLATPMPRGRAVRVIGAAFAVAAFPGLRPERALAGAVQGAAGRPVRCFVAIPMGTHEGGNYYPQYEKCCKGPNNDEQHPNQMSWVCPKDHDCGSAASGFCPCPKRCADRTCCPRSKGRCVNGTCCPAIRTTVAPGSGGRVYCCPPGTIAVPDRVGLCCRKGQMGCCDDYDPNVTGADYAVIRRELRDNKQVCVNGRLRKS